MNTNKLHYFSGITITLFVIFHLVNHFFSLLGANDHIELMNSFRVVYRNIVAESILLFAIVIQIISGIQLFKRKRKTVIHFFDRLQVWTGLYLAFFLLIHMSAVLAGRLILNVDTNLYFGVAGLNTFPFNLFFIPYYSLAIISFFGHIAAVHSKKMRSKILGISVEKQGYIIITFGIIITIILLYGLTDGFNGVEIPEEYRLV